MALCCGDMMEQLELGDYIELLKEKSKHIEAIFDVIARGCSQIIKPNTLLMSKKNWDQLVAYYPEWKK